MLTLAATQLPTEMSQLPQPVEKLHIIGNSFDELMNRPRLAVVGSRKLTPYGKGVTDKIVQELASKGVVIVSGLAYGADAAAHQACLQAGGQTIAVLPSGYDTIYPSAHTNLAKQILDKGGVLVTEYGSKHKPFAFNFLERNRIIAALSEGVLVTEAAVRSGSLNTANHALQLGKPVFAVPGNITSPLSAGTNNLIKAGGIPVNCVEDILNALKWQDLAAEKETPKGSTAEENIILELITSGISDGAELLIKSELDAGIFNQHLTMLEITGRIRQTGANNWSLA